MLWAGAIGIYAVIVTWRQWARQFRIALLLLAGMAPFLLLTLWHNHQVTGSFTTFPFTAKEPLDTFGFGYRRLMPGIKGMQYTVGEAVRGVGKNLWYLPQFLVGSYVGIRAGVRRAVDAPARPHHDRAAAAHGRVPRRLLLVLGEPAVECFRVPVRTRVLAAALRADLRVRGDGAARRVEAAPGWTVALCGVLVLGNAAVPLRLRRGATATSARDRSRGAPPPTALPGRPVVVIRDSGPYLLHLDPFSQNGPDLDQRVLYAVDHGARTFELLDRFPNRPLYIARYERLRLRRRVPPFRLRTARDPDAARCRW